MNLIKKYFWDIEELFCDSKSKKNIIFQMLGIIFIGYILCSSLIIDAKSIRDSSLSLYEAIVICSYIIAFIFGILLNLKLLSRKFFWQFSKAFIFVLGRTIILIGLIFVITFIIKFLCMIFFKIPPMTLNEYNYLSDVVWFFPIVQLIYFFIEVKKCSSNFNEKRMV